MIIKEREYDILLIEDDRATVHLLKSYFKRNYSCIAVENGKKGLEELERGLPKVIILDITLPDMSGYDVAKQIRANKSFKDIPIYFFTKASRADVNAKLEEFWSRCNYTKTILFGRFQYCTRIY